MADDIREPLDADQAEAAARRKGGALKVVGLGVITGAADDDPSAIGAYASAGAKYGLGFLWIAPVLLPMMFVVVYLSAKLGQVYGKGLFDAIRDRFPRWVLYPALIGVVIGNTIEAAADLGGIAAALNIYLPLPIPALVGAVAAVIFAIQYFGSYTVLRNIFRWLALALFAYVAAGIMARPDPLQVLRGTFVPHVRLDRDFLATVVACAGASLSAYIYTWQSNQEVEEEVAMGRRRLAQRKGATEAELRATRHDVLIGMLFSNIIVYFVILSTGSTLYPSGQHEVATAAQAAEALKPLAGEAAGLLFLAGIVGVGFLSVPIMTTGAAYDLVQGFGARGSLHAKPREAPAFYITIAGVSLAAVALNLIGFNPMKALVWSGIVQGFSVPPLLFLIMLMTNDRRVMGRRVNGLATNLLGWITTAATFAATAFLVWTWAAG